MDYQNGKIYTIRSPHTEKYYIGSTASTLVKRLSGHKSKKNTLTSKIIFDFGDAYIELLELCPCSSKIELRRREGELQRLHKNEIVNNHFECRTTQEYYSDNIEKKLKYQNEYYENNTNTIKEQKKEYYIKTAEKTKERSKEYRINNVEKLKEYFQEYKKNNAKKINEQNKKYREAKKLLNETTLT